MHIKRFEAATLQEALADVKRTLGPDALILSSRTHRKGAGVLGFMARSVVEIQAAAPHRGPGRGSAERPEPVGAVPSATRAGDTAPIAGSEESDQASLESAIGSLRSEIQKLRRSRDFEDEVRGELEALRGMLARFSRADRGGELDSAVERLIEDGFDLLVAESMVKAWRSRLGAESTLRLEDVVRERIQSVLTPPRVEERPPVRVVVGAAGVGKTTTIAKLAARNEAGERDVTLVSMDPYRIGAEEQLQRYAEFLESPFFSVADPGRIQEFAARYPRHEVFVDTAGRSRRDDSGLASLSSLREKGGRPVSIELVLDASTSLEVQRAQLSRFASLRPDRLILTKVDECASLDASRNLLLSPGCPPLSWIANGQRVPEDLTVAEVNSLYPAGIARAL